MIIDKQLPPFGDGVAVSNVRLFTVTAASQVHPIPEAWKGKLLLLRAEGGVVTWLLSSKVDATVDTSVAATAAGASSASLGAPLADGAEVRFRCPNSTGPIYFARQGTGNYSARLRIAGV